MSMLFINGSPNPRGTMARLAARLLADRTLSGMPRNLVDRRHGPIQGEFVGKRPFFVFRDGCPTCGQPDTAEWAISRLAGRRRMRYEGMVTGAVVARDAAVCA